MTNPPLPAWYKAPRPPPKPATQLSERAADRAGRMLLRELRALERKSNAARRVKRESKTITQLRANMGRIKAMLEQLAKAN